MQAPPTPEYSDASAAPSKSNMLSSGSKKRSLNNFLVDTQNIPAGREPSQNPYTETMPMNIIVPRGIPRVLDMNSMASKEPVTRQNGDDTHDKKQIASKTMQHEQAQAQAQAQAQVYRFRMEHEALTHCLIKTMTRETLEHLLANAALQYPSIMHSIITSNNPSSVMVQPSQHVQEQTTISSRRHKRNMSKITTDFTSPQSGQFSTPPSFAQHVPYAPKYTGQASSSQQTGDKEIVYDPHIHGSTLNGWTVQDDQLLKSARDRGMTWPQIQAKYFPSRTHSQCRLRLARVFGVNSRGEDRSSYTMIPWTQEEDAILLAARKSGMLWHRLQETYFTNRTHSSCSHRHRKLLRDIKRDDRVQTGASSDEHPEEDLDETEDDETVEPSMNNTSEDNRPTSRIPAEDEIIFNGREAGSQIITHQKTFFQNISQQSVDSRSCRLNRIHAIGTSRNVLSRKRHAKVLQKREGEHDDTSMNDLLTSSNEDGMEVGDKQHDDTATDEADDMTMDDLLSPSEDEDGFELVDKRKQKVPRLVTSSNPILKSLPTTAAEAQPSHPRVTSTKRRPVRIPLPKAPRESKKHPKTIVIADNDKQDEENEEPEEAQDTKTTDKDEEHPDPESTITVHVPSYYDL